MKETEQTLLNQIKDDVAKDHGMDTFAFALNVYAKSDARRIELMIDEIANRYATAKAQASCEATLKKAADNALLETNFEKRENGKVVEKWEPIISQTARLQSGAQVVPNKSSILDKSNITIV